MVVVLDFVKPSKLLISFNALHLLHLIKTDTLYGDYILENQFHSNYLQVSRKQVGDQIKPKLLNVHVYSLVQRPMLRGLSRKPGRQL